MASAKHWIIGGAVLIGVVLLISEHDSQTTSGSSSTSTTGGARPCTVTVTADVLNARSSPDGNAPVVDTYYKGEVVSADRTIRNGFRQLAPDRWVTAEFLDPTPGSDCG
ncbi:MAG TPA: SH3 domain-containing protein [Pseudonocardiaceae bacterium]|nr:SH3 domain-containing protein [Pseudonocardiaceae bacterium]